MTPRTTIKLSTLSPDSLDRIKALAAMTFVDTSSSPPVSISPHQVTDSFIQKQVDDMMQMNREALEFHIQRMIRELVSLSQQSQSLAQWAIHSHELATDVLSKAIRE